MILRVRIQRDGLGRFLAEVPALPGCLSQGKTKGEAVKNVREAVAGWLEAMESKCATRKEDLLEVRV